MSAICSGLCEPSKANNPKSTIQTEHSRAVIHKEEGNDDESLYIYARKRAGVW